LISKHRDHGARITVMAKGKKGGRREMHRIK
jgi:hypothetical protein